MANQDQITGARPTLKTVAEATGLAVTTVSRALNDAADIGQQTKERVRQAADKLGYRPNRAGLRLRTGRSHVLSLILSPETDIMSHNAQMIHALSAELRSTPYHLTVTPTLSDEDPLAPVRQMVESGSADAVILNRIQPDDPRLSYLAAQNFPVVTHGRSDMGLTHAYYDLDTRHFAELAVNALHARGRKHLLVVAPPHDQTYARHILFGAMESANTRGMSLEVLKSATSDSRFDQIEKAVLARLRAGKIDALLTPSASSAIAAVSALERLDLRLGRDIDLASKDAGPLLSRFRGEIITIREDAAAAGRFLARAALNLLDHPEAPPLQQIERPTL